LVIDDLEDFPEENNSILREQEQFLVKKSFKDKEKE